MLKDVPGIHLKFSLITPSCPCPPLSFIFSPVPKSLTWLQAPSLSFNPGHSLSSEPECLDLNLGFIYCLTVWSWEDSLIFLLLSFFICKMGARAVCARRPWRGLDKLTDIRPAPECRKDQVLICGDDYEYGYAVLPGLSMCYQKKADRISAQESLWQCP